MMRLLLSFSLLLVLLTTASAAPPRLPLRDGDRVLFLGDSNTNAGMFVQYVDAALLARYPDRRIEVLNGGLSSEGVTGLSEPEHPFPRPDVHERLGRALERVKPSAVVACYGMNDGIYYPFSEERFRKYQDGIHRLVRQVRASGARLFLITPPPFDPRPLGDRVLPAGSPRYSWMRPYAAYDEVLARYSDWLLGLRSEGVTVLDAHGPITAHLERARASETGYQLAGDGVHLNESGHWLLARVLLRAWGVPDAPGVTEIDAVRGRALRGPGGAVRREGETLVFTWSPRLPGPADPAWNFRVRTLAPALGQERLVVRGLTAPRYTLYEGQTRLGEVSAEELAAGLDPLRFPELSVSRRAARLLDLARQRERLLGPAWLTAIGHQRPQTPAGLPLDEARRRAAPLAEEIEALRKPAAVSLRLAPG